MDHIEDALQSVAESPQDTRRAAAWVELAVCHASRITRHSGSEFGRDLWKTSATTSLLNAAELGDAWARAVALRVSEALGQLVPERYDVRRWLFDAASKGSSIALESLVEVNRHDATEALRIYRQTVCGNPGQLYNNVQPKPEFMENPGLVVNSRRDTVLHWIASVGNMSMLRALAPSLLNNPLINARNEQGDTPLLCATRAGHFGLIRMILDLGADANLANVLLENPLHFLTCLDGPDIPQAAQLLVQAGSDPSAEAMGYSGNTYLDHRPRGRSCPSLRAIFANNGHELNALIKLTAHTLSVSTAHEAIPLGLVQGDPWSVASDGDTKDQTSTDDDFSTSMRKQLLNMLDAARREGGTRSNIIQFPRSSLESLVPLAPTEDGVDAAADDGYEDPDEDSDLNTGSEVIEDACPHYPVRYDHRHRVCQRPGVETAVPYHHDLHGPPVDSGPFNGPDPTVGGRLPSRPTNYRQMEGVVDAVLVAILYDRRSVLRVLLAGEAKVTMQRGDHFPCFVGSRVERDAHYNDITVRAMAKSHDTSNLVSYFPVQVWRSCVLVGNADAGAYEPFNGIIRYPVMYMTAIAMSTHRDVQLAYGNLPFATTRRYGSELTRVGKCSCRSCLRRAYEAHTNGWRILNSRRHASRSAPPISTNHRYIMLRPVDGTSWPCF